MGKCRIWDISHISKRNRGKLVTWYALKNSLRSFTIWKVFQGLEMGGHHGCSLTQLKGVGTEGVKMVFEGWYKGKCRIWDISIKNRGKLVLGTLLKIALRSFTIWKVFQG